MPAGVVLIWMQISRKFDLFGSRIFKFFFGKVWVVSGFEGWLEKLLRKKSKSKENSGLGKKFRNSGKNWIKSIKSIVSEKKWRFRKICNINQTILNSENNLKIRKFCKKILVKISEKSSKNLKILNKKFRKTILNSGKFQKNQKLKKSKTSEFLKKKFKKVQKKL